MKKRNFGWAILALIIFGFVSCEQEDRFVGANVVGGNAAQFHQAYVDLIATTLPPDTLRADRTVLQNATIGVYDEPLFGKNKSAFYTQVRLGTTNPDFGDNAIVDSVVLTIPVFGDTSDTISVQRNLINTSYTVSNVDGGDCTITDTLTTYQRKYEFEMDSLYGNRNATMTLQVHRLMQDLKTIDSARYSNKTIQTGELFGSTQISSKVFKKSTFQYATSTNNEDSTQLAADSSPVISFKLDAMRNFVQNNIVNMEGSSNLGDQVSFVRNVLSGIQLSVAEDNGFLFNINPSNLSLTAYISVDNENFEDANNNGIHDAEEDCEESNTKARITETLGLIIGSNLSLETAGTQYYNVAQSKIENLPGSIAYNQPNQSTNYLEGMGGAKVRISLDQEQIEAIRDSVRNNNWVINSAHFKVYPNMNAQGSLPLPSYLYAFNITEKSLLPDYGNGVLDDINQFEGFPFSQISVAYDSEDGYYLLRVTEFIKNIIEDNEAVDDLAIEVGNYLGATSAEIIYTPLHAYYSNRVFNPYRLAIIGANPDGGNTDKKLQLEIYYNKIEN